MIEKVIITRHPAAVAFIRQAAGLDDDVPVLAEAKAEDVAGKVVYGNLPFSLAAEAQVVFAVEFEGPAPRGQEYGLAEMVAAGARLTPYVVRRVAVEGP